MTNAESKGARTPEGLTKDWSKHVRGACPVINCPFCPQGTVPCPNEAKHTPGPPGPQQFACGVCGKMIWRGWFAVGAAGAPPNPIKCGACSDPPRDEAECPFPPVLPVGARVRCALFGDGTVVAASGYHVKFDGKATMNMSSSTLEVTALPGGVGSIGCNAECAEAWIGVGEALAHYQERAEKADAIERGSLDGQRTEQALSQPTSTDTTKGQNMNEHIIQFFAYAHLPPHLQEVSKPFGEMAQKIVDTIPRNPERTVALRKLLESKDAAVRALLAKEPA